MTLPPAPRWTRLRRLFGRRGTTLETCPSCERTALCPMSWEPLDEGHWVIDLRCGECGAWSVLVLRNDDAAAYEALLDRQASVIRSAADRLEMARMADEVDAFVAALAGDLIDAADFAR